MLEEAVLMTGHQAYGLWPLVILNTGLFVLFAASFSLQHAGRTWWFCSTACRDEYRVDPERFANPVAGAAGGPP
jgi:YHS domain-containing protein